MVLLLLAQAPLIIRPALAETSTVSIINPGPDGYPAKWTAGPDTAHIGTADFYFNSDTTETGDTFFMNITIRDVVNMKSWGIGIIYKSSALQFVSAWRPPDHVFAYPESQGASPQVPSVSIDDVNETYKILKWGYAYLWTDEYGNPIQWGFNGSGVLCQIQFRITAAVDQLNPVEEAYFAFDPEWTAVFRFGLPPPGKEIPNMESAYWKYEWVRPTLLPQLYVYPGIYKDDTLKKGDIVTLEVRVRDVHPGWTIIGFQFSLWFNTSCLEPVGYEVGTWMQGFANNGESVMHAAYADYHGVDPELPYCYNKWFAIIFLVKGNENKYWAPFPSGEGTLFKFRFKAIHETIFPLEPEHWTELELHDVEVRNQYGMIIETKPPLNGLFRCPIKTLGLRIDVFTEYPAPYGGQGLNNPSDMFAPQAEVNLYAQVLYNEDPVQQKLVSFGIRHGEFYIYRENYTDVNGIAWIKFRIPWPCDNPADRVLGEWQVIATVEVAQQKKNDTLAFKVWWPVEIVSVTPKKSEYVKTKPDTPNMEFVVVYRTCKMIPIDVVLTVVVYDELGFFIGSAKFKTTVGLDEYTYCTFKDYEQEFVIPMPTNAVVGTATVYANAYDDLPWNGGVPYCPEVSNTFVIKKA
jgi:hypothetical protein